jgi:hypothetical protein
LRQLQVGGGGRWQVVAPADERAGGLVGQETAERARALERGQEPGGVERLREKLVAGRNRAEDDMWVRLTGEHDARDVRMLLLHHCEKLPAAHRPHVYV